MWLLSFLSFPTVNCSLDSVKWATRFGTLSNSSTSQGAETLSFTPVQLQISHPCHSIKRVISCTWADFNNNFNLTSWSERKCKSLAFFVHIIALPRGFQANMAYLNWGPGEERQSISGNKGTSYNLRDQKAGNTSESNFGFKGTQAIFLMRQGHTPGALIDVTQ